MSLLHLMTRLPTHMWWKLPHLGHPLLRMSRLTIIIWTLCLTRGVVKLTLLEVHNALYTPVTRALRPLQSPLTLRVIRCSIDELQTHTGSTTATRRRVLRTFVREALPTLCSLSFVGELSRAHRS